MKILSVESTIPLRGLEMVHKIINDISDNLSKWSHGNHIEFEIVGRLFEKKIAGWSLYFRKDGVNYVYNLPINAFLDDYFYGSDESYNTALSEIIHGIKDKVKIALLK